MNVGKQKITQIFEGNEMGSLRGNYYTNYKRNKDEKYKEIEEVERKFKMLYGKHHGPSQIGKRKKMIQLDKQDWDLIRNSLSTLSYDELKTLQINKKKNELILLDDIK